MKKLILPTILLLIISCSTGASHSENNTLVQDIENLIKFGFIGKIDLETNKVWVMPEFWSSLTVETQKIFTSNLAEYMHLKSNEKSRSVYVYDYHTDMLLSQEDISGYILY